MRILAWLVFAKRPLKRYELFYGVSLTPDTPFLDGWSILGDTTIDKCKPLIEELPNGTITLIHYTARE